MAINRRRITRGVGKYVSLIILSILVLVMIFPLIMITLTSFKSESEYYANGPLALPKGLDFTMLAYTWQSTDYSRLLMNSAVISISAALLAVAAAISIRGIKPLNPASSRFTENIKSLFFRRFGTLIIDAVF